MNRTGISIQKNKRNGRKQEQHMKIMRAIQEVVNPDWREGNGRKSAQEQVKEWQAANPTGTKSQCKTETGLTYPTIRRWWNS